jgi:glycosyltransferase involved in cell wall biosynthesis
MIVPVTIAARNEERALGPCLDALLEAARHAEARGPLRFDLLVVLDDCTDGTEAVARSRGVRSRRSSGGKVEAQRKGLRGGPFSIFTDADVLVSPPTLGALSAVMLSRPEVFVAFPQKVPLPPVSTGRLARALHVYNRERGFSSQRTWFNGKCFAIRRYEVPAREELAARAARLRLPMDRFYDYAAAMRVDDVYLSRRVVAERGPSALAETTEGCVYFRAPETLRGMYRYYLRMRRELERVSALFPELEGAHARSGARRADRLAEAPLSQQIAYVEFQLALALCRAGYRLERAYWQRFAAAPCPAWPPIEETKCSLATAIPGSYRSSSGT